jgi:hypothetical protein
MFLFRFQVRERDEEMAYNLEDILPAASRNTTPQIREESNERSIEAAPEVKNKIKFSLK